MRSKAAIPSAPSAAELSSSRDLQSHKLGRAPFSFTGDVKKKVCTSEGSQPTCLAWGSCRSTALWGSLDLPLSHMERSHHRSALPSQSTASCSTPWPPSRAGNKAQGDEPQGQCHPYAVVLSPAPGAAASNSEHRLMFGTSCYRPTPAAPGPKAWLSEEGRMFMGRRAALLALSHS